MTTIYIKQQKSKSYQQKMIIIGLYAFSIIACIYQLKFIKTNLKL